MLGTHGREAWNATLELPTALTLLQEGIPKLIHYFGSADPDSTDPSVEGAMASFLVPAPGNIYVNLGGFARRFSTVTGRFSGSWCRFPESWGQDGGNGENTGKKREKMGEKWPKRVGVS